MESNTKKNVVLLIPQLRHGGAERVVSRLSFLLSSHFNVNIVVFDDTVITYDVGCDISSLNVPSSTKNNIISKVINIIKRIKRYRKFKKKYKIDVTYSFGDTANIINILSGGQDNKVISIRGYKRIRTGKTFKERMIMKPISIYLCKKANRIVSVSELITHTLIKEYNLPPGKVITIHNGYDVKTIKNLSNEDLDPQENEFFTSNMVIITAGTFRYEKGYWHLLKAFSISLKMNSGLKLAILGEDYDDNKEKIIELAKKLNIHESIIYFGYKENPYKYFSRSRIYVLSSIFEGFPNALVEAMSCGLPVVAADCPSGPREILSPSSNFLDVCKGVELSEYGILVQRMSSEENYNYMSIEECDKSLAEGINKLIDNELNSRYVNKSIQRSNEFDYKTWFSKQKNALEFR